MMSNCAFWSTSGELLAVHGVGPSDPAVSFGPWAAIRRFPAGRLVALSPPFPVEAQVPGWQALAAAPVFRTGKPPRPCESSAPVATPAPALDEAASRLLPMRTDHEKFTLKAWPTWVTTVNPVVGEGPSGWYAGLEGAGKVSRFLIRLVPHRGRLPGDGWRNMLAWTLREKTGIRLVPLHSLPTLKALSAAPAWEYRVEAGRGLEAAAWDVQILPSRKILKEWAPETLDPWEATALLRWVRPGGKPFAAAEPLQTEPRWADLFARLPVADARLLVQNVLTTLPGGAAEAAFLFYDTVMLPPHGGTTLVRHVPQDGLPMALLSTLFGRRAWQEIDRAKRFLPAEDEQRTRRAEALADLDLRLAEGRLNWSEQALELWRVLYRDPQRQAREAELIQWRRGDRWIDLLKGNPLIPEAVLRALDVTDVALCLRDVPDTRWRRFVSSRREAELREELAFCQDWEARGELTVERQLDAWRSFDEMIRSFPAP